MLTWGAPGPQTHPTLTSRACLPVCFLSAWHPGVAWNVCVRKKEHTVSRGTELLTKSSLLGDPNVPSVKELGRGNPWPPRQKEALQRPRWSVGRLHTTPRCSFPGTLPSTVLALPDSHVPIRSHHLPSVSHSPAKARLGCSNTGKGSGCHGEISTACYEEPLIWPAMCHPALQTPGHLR